MKILCSILFCLLALSSNAQTAYDLIVTGSFSPSTVELGESSEFQLELCNFTLDGSIIPAGGQSLTVVIGGGALPDAATPPTGAFAANFTWLFVPPNIWYGVSTAPMAFGCGYMVNIPVVATEVSSNSSNYDGNIMSPNSDSQPANDTGSAVLLVGAVLPVEFGNIDVSASDCKNAELSWTTVSETNNKGFSVQRRTDLSEEFIEIGFVSADNLLGADYSFLDDLRDVSSKAKQLYYRLEQIDLDGQSNFSQIVTTRLDCGKRLSISGYPNPVLDQYTVEVSGLIGPADLTVTNMQGQKVRSFSINDEASLNIDLAGLPSGSYNLGLYSTAGQLLESRRIIKLSN